MWRVTRNSGVLCCAGAEILKIQVTSLTDLAPDRMLITGIGTSYLHDLADISSLKEGQLLTVTEGDASTIAPPQANVPAPVPASADASPAPASSPHDDKIFGFLPSSMDLLAPGGQTTKIASLASSKVVGLYFSAHW